MPEAENIHQLITTVDSTAQYPLGFEVVQPAAGAGSATADKNIGERVWIYVENDSGGDIVQGEVCRRKAATSTYKVRKTAAATANGAVVVGVAQHTIASTKFGFILRKGLGEVLADTGGLTADGAIKVGADVAGRADDAGVNDAAFGWTTETVAATALATCYVNCRG